MTAGIGFELIGFWNLLQHHSSHDIALVHYFHVSFSDGFQFGLSL